MLQLAALVFALAVSVQTALALPIPNYCGDPCSPEGASAGCRCNGFRDICHCINGHWVNHV
jgi:hypothetical protein